MSNSTTVQIGCSSEVASPFVEFMTSPSSELSSSNMISAIPEFGPIIGMITLTAVVGSIVISRRFIEA